MIRLFRAAAVAAGLAAWSGVPLLAFGQGGRPALSPEDSKVVAAFQVRVADYIKLHEKVEGSLKPLPKEATPEQVDISQRQLMAGIIAARAGAKPGDIFTPDIQAYLRRVLATQFAGKEGAERRASVLDENPIGTPVRVNGPYPDEIPLSTMPPQVIEALPKLPAQLEFRFIGDRLILFDHHAHLMVDYVDRALPRG
jgi:hypothetical protein